MKILITLLFLMQFVSCDTFIEYSGQVIDSTTLEPLSDVHVSLGFVRTDTIYRETGPLKENIYQPFYSDSSGTFRFAKITGYIGSINNLQIHLLFEKSGYEKYVYQPNQMTESGLQIKIKKL
ncbi:hypothetical protein JNM05_15920 [bacterium]|nr:hypothetical protein [bacterium]